MLREMEDMPAEHDAFERFALERHPELNDGSAKEPFLDDDRVGELLEKEGFEQTLLDYARQHPGGPRDPRLGRMIDQLAQRAVLGERWQRSWDIISGPWELEVIGISDHLHRRLREMPGQPGLA